jgi:hypothetical protein
VCERGKERREKKEASKLWLSLSLAPRQLSLIMCSSFLSLLNVGYKKRGGVGSEGEQRREARGFRERVEKRLRSRSSKRSVRNQLVLSFSLLVLRSNVESVSKVASHDHPADEQPDGAEEALLKLFAWGMREERRREKNERTTD